MIFMKKSNLFGKIYFMVVFMLVFSEKAHAYIDPGTGSMVIQIFIATFAGIIYAIKLQWNNLKAFLNGLLSKNSKRD